MISGSARAGSLVDDVPHTISCDHGVPKPTAPTRFLVRQPILDDKQKIYGYELLHRELPAEPLSEDPEKTIQQVIDNCLLLMPESNQAKSFVDCTREILVTGLATLLPRRNTVLKILDIVEADAEVLASCRFLRKKGYRFALDFLPFGAKEIFLDFAEYIKIDFQAFSPEDRRPLYPIALNARNEVKLIAEKIETPEEMEIARGEGCQLFQGPFVSRPSIVSHQIIPNNQLICLRLMAALCEEPADTKKIETLVMMDTALCYRLLRLVNSALYSLSSRISSIRGALVIVGTDEFRKLVTISLAGTLAATQSQALVALALERARFCEALAPRLKEEGPKLYLLGMLSLIDAILEIPMYEVIHSLPLDPDMKAALTGDASTISVALELIRSYQAGDWDACAVHQKKLGLEECVTSKIYMECVRWADEVIRQ